MKRRKHILKAAPVPVSSGSGALAGELGLPISGPGATRIVIGRREWIALPEFGGLLVNAKVDSGAWTSSLHAVDVKLDEAGESVRFVTTDRIGRHIDCEAAVARLGRVKNSGGKARRRVFIEVDAVLPGGFCWRVQFTLADRSAMSCPVLLGRRALAGFFLIDPQGNHLLGGVRDFNIPPAGPPSP